ncbi:hypothetical protein HYH03_000610 [Edaphochlamys debaryana]|uniref:Protein kinase domain-containing protein n=1 Tax=Edaphochlamys debaryana TaxID=47281 RepID=A0A835YJ10_9CHLO|nr:hypothetical protein HYH03_000610 [Edaphochlamys debaryana]|eukprot:KAG2502118.1 hypothetical protein HYH03_000610 [Edaphochlamys debaryana]
MVKDVEQLLAGVAIEPRSAAQLARSSSAVFKGLWTGARVSVKLVCIPSQNCGGSWSDFVVALAQSHPYLIQTYLARGCIATAADAAAAEDAAAMPSKNLSQPPRGDRLLSIRELGEPEPAGAIASATGGVSQGAQGLLSDGPSLGIESILGSAFEDVTLDQPGDCVVGPRAAEVVLARLRPAPGDCLVLLVTELCLGGDARDAVLATAPWPAKHRQRAAISTAREVALGLLHLHLLGRAHGNLRPSNVLLVEAHTDRRGFAAKVADAGLGERHCPPAQQPPDMFRYQAPELLLRRHQGGGAAAESVDMQAADAWSFGCLLHELLTARPPFACCADAAQLLAALAAGTEPCGALAALSTTTCCDPALVALCRACLALDPGLRPSMAALLAQLNDVEARLRRAGPTAAVLSASAGPSKRQSSSSGSAHGNSAAGALRSAGGRARDGPGRPVTVAAIADSTFGRLTGAASSGGCLSVLSGALQRPRSRIWSGVQGCGRHAGAFPALGLPSCQAPHGALGMFVAQAQAPVAYTGLGAAGQGVQLHALSVSEAAARGLEDGLTGICEALDGASSSFGDASRLLLDYTEAPGRQFMWGY